VAVLGKVATWLPMAAMLAFWLLRLGSSGSTAAWMSAAALEMGLEPAVTTAARLVTTTPTAGLAASTEALSVA
jgi:hypothetical protein